MRVVVGILLLVLVGCGPSEVPSSAIVPPGGPGPNAQIMAFGATSPTGDSDPELVRTADVSVLYIGNSHTMLHDLPGLVGRMLRFRQPGKTYYSHLIGVSFLDDSAYSSRCKDEIEHREWKHVVLQGQRISVSGKQDYSRKDGIELAKLGKAIGARVFFFPEWGLKGKAGDGSRQEKVYREMAKEAEVGVAPVGRAWDLALAERPDLVLYAADGNHQSALGAFLTAAILFGQVTGESPAGLGAFPYAQANDADRQFLSEIAAKALAGEAAGKDKR